MLLLLQLMVPLAAPAEPWALHPGYVEDGGGSTGNGAFPRCGCANRTLCQPITTPPPAQELLVFLEASGPGNMTHDFFSWDWSRITTVAVCHAEKLPPLAMAALTCRAHAAGARVVWAKFVTQGQDLPLLPVAAMHNASARAAWISRHVALIKATGTDGINLDTEVPVAAGSAAATVLTLFTTELRAALCAALPDGGGQLTMCTPSLAFGPCMYNRCYEYARLAEVLDFLVVMDYSGNGVGRLQGISPWMATAALPSIQTGVAFYRSLGIQAAKLVLVVPWFGFAYDCNSTELPDGGSCTATLMPVGLPDPQDNPGSPLARYSITDLVALPSSSGRQLDPTSTTAFTSFLLNGTAQSVFFDDAETIKPKVDYAKAAGARGVGVYSATYLNYAKKDEAAAMWAALSGSGSGSGGGGGGRGGGESPPVRERVRRLKVDDQDLVRGSPACKHALQGCWPVKSDHKRCKACEATQQRLLHDAGCREEDIARYCAVPPPQLAGVSGGVQWGGWPWHGRMAGRNRARAHRHEGLGDPPGPFLHPSDWVANLTKRFNPSLIVLDIIPPMACGEAVNYPTVNSQTHEDLVDLLIACKAAGLKVLFMVSLNCATSEATYNKSWHNEASLAERGKPWWPSCAANFAEQASEFLHNLAGGTEALARQHDALLVDTIVAWAPQGNNDLGAAETRIDVDAYVPDLTLLATSLYNTSTLSGRTGTLLSFGLPIIGPGGKPWSSPGPMGCGGVPAFYRNLQAVHAHVQYMPRFLPTTYDSHCTDITALESSAKVMSIDVSDILLTDFKLLTWPCPAAGCWAAGANMSLIAKAHRDVTSLKTKVFWLWTLPGVPDSFYRDFIRRAAENHHHTAVSNNEEAIRRLKVDDDAQSVQVHVAQPPPSHLKFFSFYSHGDDPVLTAQRGIVNVRLGHDAAYDTHRQWWTRRSDGSLATNFSNVIAGHRRFGMASFLDIEELVWNRSLYPAVPAFTTTDYKAMISAVVRAATPLLASGAVRGLFLGDELCCTGTSPENLTAVANFCRARLQTAGHGSADVYINECARSFIGAGEWGGGEWPGWIKGKIPEGLTLVSLDNYMLANATNKTTRQVTPYWSAEVQRVQKLYKLAFPPERLHPHQRLMVVPGLYGNDSATAAEHATHDGQLVKKMELYWQWIQNDTQIVGLCPCEQTYLAAARGLQYQPPAVQPPAA